MVLLSFFERAPPLLETARIGDVTPEQRLKFLSQMCAPLREFEQHFQRQALVVPLVGQSTAGTVKKVRGGWRIGSCGGLPQAPESVVRGKVCAVADGVDIVDLR